jgi:hypothetical protein
MPKREVDKRKTTKALRKLRRVAERASEEGGPGLTTWEKDFVEGVTERLETYGSAFRDPAKGRLEEALSARQAQITRVIDKKSRKSKTADPGKPGDKTEERPRSTFKQRQPMRAQSARKESARKQDKAGKPKSAWKPRIRDINEDIEPAAPPEPPPLKPGPPSLKIIPGGKR